MTSNIDSWIKGAILGLVIIAFSMQMGSSGRADNGDFTWAATGPRSGAFFTSKPMGFEVNWPPLGTPEWDLRFFHYWLPYWKLNFPALSGKGPKTFVDSSAVLLWMPGVLANWLLYSRKVLYMPYISLLPRLLLFLSLVMTFRWAEGFSPGRRRALYLTLSAPLALILMDGNIMSFLNSFYQESATLTFAVLCVALLLCLDRTPSTGRYIMLIVASGLLATSKIAHFYLSLPMFLVALLPNPVRAVRARPAVYASGAMLAVFFTVLMLSSPRNYLNTFHTLFDGTLEFSKNPQSHLNRLNMPGAMDKLKADVFFVEASFFEANKESLSHKSSLMIILREPSIFVKMLKYSADKMQDVVLEDIGQKPFGQPEKLKQPAPRLWSQTKNRYFPRGVPLLAVLTGFLVYFTFQTLRGQNAWWALARAGLFSALCAVSEMVISIFGSGKADLTKHLFLANIMFDLALIIFLNCLMLQLMDRFSNQGSEPEISQSAH